MRVFRINTSKIYNAENRPVRWESGDTVITMNFDRMGRRVFYKEEVNGVVTKHHRFVYDNYLCVQKVDALNNNAQINLFVWDPTESIATRPLFTTGSGNRKFFYTFDGNKNVSELVHFETRNGIAAHYDYAPFGAITRAISTSAITDNSFTTDNPFRFSSEYHDDTLGLVYYNYRHYNPTDARWCGRDLLESESEYLFLKQAFICVDFLGLVDSKNLTIYTSQDYAVPRNDNLSFLCSLPGFAACNRGRDINPKSISENKEYCGLVCKRCDPISKTMIYTTTVTSGIETPCSPLSALCQEGWDAVATWHTHGGNSPGYCNEDFSPRDKVAAMANHLPIYLITPTNQFKIYLPDSDKIIDLGKIYK